MKLSTLTFCAFLFSFLNVQAQHGGRSEKEKEENHHCLFKKNSISIGLGAPYSFHFNGVGINARVYYNIGEQICFFLFQDK